MISAIWNALEIDVLVDIPFRSILFVVVKVETTFKLPVYLDHSLQ